MEAETQAMWWQTKECQQSPEGERGQGTDLLAPPKRTHPADILIWSPVRCRSDFWPLELWEQICIVLRPLSSLKCYSIKGTNTVTKVTPFLRKWKVSIFPHRKKQTKKIPPLSIGTICCQLQTIWKYSIFPIYYNFIYRFLLILAL